MKYPDLLKYTKLMYYLGLWPFPTNKSVHLKMLIRVMYTTLGVLYLAFLAAVIGGITKVKTAEEFRDSYIGFLIVNGFSCWKVVLSQTKVIKKLTNEIFLTSRRLARERNEAVKDIYVKVSKYNSKLFFTLAGITNGAGVAYILYLIVEATRWKSKEYYIDNNETRALQCLAWYPVDVDQYYEILFFHQALGCYAGIVYDFMGEWLLLSLITFAVFRLKVLKCDFAHFGDYCRNNHETPDKTLRNLILEHKDLIRYVNELNSTTKWLFFGDLLTKSYHVSITIFTMLNARSDRDVDFFGAFTGFAGIFFLLGKMICLYYIANEITLESLAISSAIYEGNWYEQPTAIKRSLLIVMIRSERPLELKIGVFDVVNINTFLKILKAAYTGFVLTFM